MSRLRLRPAAAGLISLIWLSGAVWKFLSADEFRRAVRDQPEVMVLSLGRRGDDSEKSNNRDIDALRDWLAAHPEAGLRETGAPRTLTYNDPFVREQDRWSEVQLIVDRAAPQP